MIRFTIYFLQNFNYGMNNYIADIILQLRICINTSCTLLLQLLLQDIKKLKNRFRNNTKKISKEALIFFKLYLLCLFRWSFWCCRFCYWSFWRNRCFRCCRRLWCYFWSRSRFWCSLWSYSRFWCSSGF